MTVLEPDHGLPAAEQRALARADLRARVLEVLAQEVGITIEQLAAAEFAAEVCWSIRPGWRRLPRRLSQLGLRYFGRRWAAAFIRDWVTLGEDLGSADGR